MANDLGDEKYVRLTTFTKDGRPKHTPVWIANWNDDFIGTTTDVDSWKVRRLRNTPMIEVASSDSRGNVIAGTETVAGTAEVVADSDPSYADLESALVRKYGLQYWLFRMIRKLRPRRLAPSQSRSARFQLCEGNP